MERKITRQVGLEFSGDGLMIEVSSWGEEPGALRPLCDADQAITPSTLGRIVRFIQSREAATEVANDMALLDGLARVR